MKKRFVKASFVPMALPFIMILAMWFSSAGAVELGGPKANYDGLYTVIEAHKSGKDFIKLRTTVTNDRESNEYVLIYRDGFVGRFSPGDTLRISISFDGRGIIASFWKETDLEEENGWQCCFEIYAVYSIPSSRKK